MSKRKYIKVVFDGKEEYTWKPSKKYKNYWIDPTGFSFKWGHMQDNGDMAMYYRSERKSGMFMQKEDFLKLQNIISVQEQKEKEERNLETLHNMWKPGSLRYFFTKETSLLGKK